VVKMKASGGALEGRVFVVARGDAAVVSKTYRAGDIRDAVHELANDIVQSFTGQRGVFGSRLAFAPHGSGTQVEWTSRFEVTVPLVGPLLGLVAARRYAASFTKLLRQAKTRLIRLLSARTPIKSSEKTAPKARWARGRPTTITPIAVIGSQAYRASRGRPSSMPLV